MILEYLAHHVCQFNGNEMQWLRILHELKGIDGQDHFKDFNTIILISFRKKLCIPEKYSKLRIFFLHKSL